VLYGQGFPDTCDSGMRPLDGVRQESRHVPLLLDPRRTGLEAVHERLSSNLCGTLALRMPAHTVYDDKKSSAIMADNRYSILIITAITD
jgi:hypothetical protein